MKKRLLITSIVMMLVVAVALSTATYAWFTSNSSVKATAVTMYADTNSAASIGISWTDGAYGPALEAESPASTFYYAPTAISSLTANTAISSINWTSATIKDVAGNATFNNDVITAAGSGSTDDLVYTWNDGTGSGKGHTSFYIHNGSTANTLSAVTATVTITGAAAPFIRVGFFKYDSTASAFKLKGVITDAYVYTTATGTSENGVKYYKAEGAEVLTGNGTDAIPANSFTRAARGATNNAALGTATANETVASTITDTAISTSVDLGGLDVDTNAGDAMQLKVLVWMDGSALNDDTATNSHLTASVVLHFDATRGAYTADTFGA